MFAKCLSIVLALSLLYVAMVRPVLAQTNAIATARSAEKVETERNNYTPAATNVESKEAKSAAKVKAGIAKLGTGSSARVEVKLRDKTKIKGYISEATEDYFVVVEDKTGEATQVPYQQVKKVKGKNNLTGEQIGIIVIIGLIVITAIGYARK